MRKFRVQFLDLEHHRLTAQQACLECVRELSLHFEITEFQNNEPKQVASGKSGAAAKQPQKQPPRQSLAPWAPDGLGAMTTSQTMADQQMTSAAANRSQRDTSRGKKETAMAKPPGLSLQDLVKVMNVYRASPLNELAKNLSQQTLFARNVDQLPLFYQQIEPKNFVAEEEEMDPKEKSFLAEFLTSSLMDPSFPAFVRTVEDELGDLLKNELNIS